jgi:hypothetical protein
LAKGLRLLGKKDGHGIARKRSRISDAVSRARSLPVSMSSV